MPVENDEYYALLFKDRPKGPPVLGCAKGWPRIASKRGGPLR